MTNLQGESMNSLMTLTTTSQKPTIPTKSSTSETVDSDITTEVDDFISILYAQIKDGVKSSSEKTVNFSTDISDNNSEIDAKKNAKEKSSDEILLDEVLNIITQLKGDDSNSENFPKFSDKMDKMLNNESVKNDFKNVKNLDDVIKLSKKYNLGLENIEFSKVDKNTLKKDFPKLDFENFFNTKENTESSSFQTTTKIKDKTTLITNTITRDDNGKISTKPYIPKNDILQNLLKDIDTKTINKTEKEVSPKGVELAKDLKKDDKVSDTKNSDSKEKNTVNTNQPKHKDIEKEVSSKGIELAKDLGTKEKNTVNANQPKHKDIEKEVSPKGVELAKDLGTKEKNTVNANQPKHKDVEKEVSPKGVELAKDLKKDDKVLDTKNSDSKEIKTTLVNNTKEQKIETKQGSEDRILHKIKTHRQDSAENLNNQQNNSSNQKKEDDSSSRSQEIKNELVNQKQEFKNSFTVENSKAPKQADIKSSLNYFSNDLKEKMEQYKPPIMKVQMTLNPKNLGEVDVTIINRGNNLHVNITSNTNTMSLFTQNQAEFKNSLVNMGFTNLEMNFSDQGKNSQQNQQNSKNRGNSFKEFNDNENRENSVELIFPKYV